MSNGEIIGWLNADDAYADRRAIEYAVSAFERYPEAGAVYGHTLMINAENRVLQLLWSPAFAAALLPGMTPFRQPAVFLRRSALPEPFLREDLHFVMDRDLWLRMRATTRFRRIDLVTGIDRQHATRKVMSQAYHDELKAYEREGLGRPLPAALRKAITVSLRLRGLLSVPGLEHTLQPAIDLRFDDRLHFALRQLMLPQRAFPAT
jgi:hypothetical protein